MPAPPSHDQSHDPILPTNQHRYEGLPELAPEVLQARRERVFLVLSGLFLGTLAMLNILGITRFIKLYEIDRPDAATITFAVAVGVLPYPITFLCTDFISELYGKARASRVVWMGLALNLWVVLILWIGGALPGFEPVNDQGARITSDPTSPGFAFFEVRRLAFGAVTASMLAYLAAQFTDVYLFHFWKRLTKGKLLWVRNNGSTMVSQAVDTVAVILITYSLGGLDHIISGADSVAFALLTLIATGYAFKWVAALIDTIPFYFGAVNLSRYLRVPPPGHESAHLFY